MSEDWKEFGTEVNSTWNCVVVKGGVLKVYTGNSALVMCRPVLSDQKWLCSFSGMSLGCISPVVYSRSCLERTGWFVLSARQVIFWLAVVERGDFLFKIFLPLLSGFSFFDIFEKAWQEWKETWNCSHGHSSWRIELIFSPGVVLIVLYIPCEFWPIWTTFHFSPI